MGSMHTDARQIPLSRRLSCKHAHIANMLPKVLGNEARRTRRWPLKTVLRVGGCLFAAGMLVELKDIRGFLRGRYDYAWREQRLQELVYVHHPENCEYWGWSENYEAISKGKIPGLDSTVLLTCSGRTYATETILREGIPDSKNVSVIPNIDRIYYINLDHRPLRRAIMGSWLSKQSIPYHRVAALKGEPDICIAEKQGRQCIGLSGVARSNMYIMDHLNVTGTTLVLEDDFVIRDMDKLLASVQLVPPDWDILRWDCWDDPRPYFTQYSPYSFKVGPKDFNACLKHNISSEKECEHCGGLHVAMWRGGESLKKLRKLWARQPHDDIDCLLQDPSINSYCIQVGIGEFHHPAAELSDIPKIPPGA